MRIESFLSVFLSFGARGGCREGRRTLGALPPAAGHLAVCLAPAGRMGIESKLTSVGKPPSPALFGHLIELTTPCKHADPQM